MDEMKIDIIVDLIRSNIKFDKDSDNSLEEESVEKLAKLIAKEIKNANIAGYFRAMEDIRSGELERLNNL
jgi:ribosomal protein S17E